MEDWKDISVDDLDNHFKDNSTAVGRVVGGGIKNAALGAHGLAESVRMPGNILKEGLKSILPDQWGKALEQSTSKNVGDVVRGNKPAQSFEKSTNEFIQKHFDDVTPHNVGEDIGQRVVGYLPFTAYSTLSAGLGLPAIGNAIKSDILGATGASVAKNAGFDGLGEVVGDVLGRGSPALLRKAGQLLPFAKQNSQEIIDQSNAAKANLYNKNKEIITPLDQKENIKELTNISNDIDNLFTGQNFSEGESKSGINNIKRIFNKFFGADLDKYQSSVEKWEDKISKINETMSVNKNLAQKEIDHIGGNLNKQLESFDKKTQAGIQDIENKIYKPIENKKLDIKYRPDRQDKPTESISIIESDKDRKLKNYLKKRDITRNQIEDKYNSQLQKISHDLEVENQSLLGSIDKGANPSNLIKKEANSNDLRWAQQELNSVHIDDTGSKAGQVQSRLRNFINNEIEKVGEKNPEWKNNLEVANKIHELNSYESEVSKFFNDKRRNGKYTIKDVFRDATDSKALKFLIDAGGLAFLLAKKGPKGLLYAAGSKALGKLASKGIKSAAASYDVRKRADMMQEYIMNNPQAKQAFQETLSFMNTPESIWTPQVKKEFQNSLGKLAIIIGNSSIDDGDWKSVDINQLDRYFS